MAKSRWQVHRLCEACAGLTLPKDVRETCTTCRDLQRSLSRIRHELEQVFPQSRSMTPDDVLRRLVEFRIKHRDLS